MVLTLGNPKITNFGLLGWHCKNEFTSGMTCWLTSMGFPAYFGLYGRFPIYKNKQICYCMSRKNIKKIRCPLIVN